MENDLIERQSSVRRRQQKWLTLPPNKTTAQNVSDPIWKIWAWLLDRSIRSQDAADYIHAKMLRYILHIHHDEYGSKGWYE